MTKPKKKKKKKRLGRVSKRRDRFEYWATLEFILATNKEKTNTF